MHNIEVIGAARLYRAASVRTAGLGAFVPFGPKLNHRRFPLNANVVRKGFGSCKALVCCSSGERKADFDTAHFVPCLTYLIYANLICAPDGDSDFHNLWSHKHPLFKTWGFIGFIPNMEADLAELELAGMRADVAWNNGNRVCLTFEKWFNANFGNNVRPIFV